MSWACVVCGKNTNNHEPYNGKRVPMHKACAEKLKKKPENPKYF